MGGGCPALEYTSSPVSGLSTAQTAVVHWARGSRAANRSSPASAAPGLGLSNSSARQALRTLPHHGGCGQAVADTIPDDQCDAPVVQVDNVVPVTADLKGPRGGLIAHLEPAR